LEQKHKTHDNEEKKQPGKQVPYFSSFLSLIPMLPCFPDYSINSSGLKRTAAATMTLTVTTRPEIE
jgi:hypothetical protein